MITSGEQLLTRTILGDIVYKNLNFDNCFRPQRGMLSPTHVQVIVHRAENLLIKGKNGSNNSFVVIELGKESYRTSIKEKSGESVTWNEECELKIPKAGNTALLDLTAYHTNALGLDQFLGRVKIPLSSFEKFQRTTQWYRLQGKAGKEKGKDKVRGELEVQIGFLSRSQSQSLTSLQSKGKISLQKLTGSSFSLRLGDSKNGVKSIAKTVFKRKKKDSESAKELEETDINLTNGISSTKEYNNLDPGVVSDEEDDGSRKSSESLGNFVMNSRNTVDLTPPPKPRRSFAKNPEISISQWEDNNLKSVSSLAISQTSVNSHVIQRPKLEDLRGRLTDRRLSISCVDFSHLSTPKPEKKFSSTLQLEKHPPDSHKGLSRLARKLKNLHSSDRREGKRSADSSESNVALEEGTMAPKSEFKNKNKDELINMVVDLQKRVNCISLRVKDLEDYLDGILLKVMETVPKILEKS